MRRSCRRTALTVCLGCWAVSATGCGGTIRDTDRQAPSTSRSPDYYVSPKGNDRHDGSRRRPWRTIARAAAQVGPGSTVHVAAGRYVGSVLLHADGEPGRPIRFASDTRWGARITASASGPVGIVRIAGDYVEFAGFDVSGRGGDGTVGILVSGSHDRVTGNDVHDVVVACGGPNGGGGIVAGGGTPDYRNHDIDVVGNLVHDVVGTPTQRCPGVQGIYASVPRVRIVNNVSYRNGDGCITSWHAASRLTIVNNTVLDCATGIAVGSGGPGAGAGNIGTTVANNIVSRCGAGIAETTDGEHRVGPGNRYLKNLVFRSGNVGWLSGRASSDGAAVSGTIAADPQLMGSQADYRPTAASPAIDAGVGTGAPRSDFDGVRRPQGRRVDIGAFEWRGSSP